MAPGWINGQDRGLGSIILKNHWLKEGLLDWLYPPRCPVCGEIVPAGDDRVCSACRNGFRRVVPPVCCRCGRMTEQEEEFCEDCRKKRFSYVQGFPVWVYNQAMRRSIADFKYRGRKEYAVYYGQEFAKAYGRRLKELSVQALIPVPLYWKKCRKRGYNQAELFAEEIGRRLGIVVCRDYLFRVRDTVPQKDLNDRQRYANLKSAFAVDQQKRRYYAGIKNVVLVDDIYTTGSTVEMCTKVLLRAGIEKVYFASISIGSL